MSIDEATPQASSEDVLLKFHEELGKVSGNPRSMIIITNAFLELLIDTLIEEHFRTADIILSDTRTYPYSVRITFVQEAGFLPKPLCEHLREFNNLRNNAAHDIKFYGKAETTTYLKDKIEPLRKYYRLEKGADLQRICTWISGDTWNKHPTFFLKKLGGS